MKDKFACAAIETLAARADERGLSVLSDAELVALVAVGPAAPASSYRSGLLAAEGLLESSGGVRRVLGLARPAASESFGSAGALVLAAAAELGRRAAASALGRGVRLLSSRSVAGHFGPLLAAEPRELFYALLVDTRNRLISKVRVSEGSLAASLVHPREAFAHAVRAAAAAVIFLHNHPSGDPEPSREDRRLTERLVAGGRLLGIPVLDHVVVAGDAHYSFADHGEIGTGRAGTAA